tara:strand:+ start:494 stop:1417 length:924 start_codon:yes stop_codon:yes gene_type:complete
MSGFDAESFNTLFLGRLDEPAGIEKANKAGGAYVRLRLREKAVNRGILPPETVTKEDCQRSINHDLLVKIVDIEQNSSASAMNFRSSANVRYINGKRYEIPFWKIASDRFQADEGELLASDYPVTKTIEDQTVRDMDRVEDQTFFEYSWQITDGATGTGKVNTAVGPVDRTFISNCLNVLEDSDELAVDCVVMHKSDWNDWITLPASDVGDQLAGEMVVNGYKYNQIMGHKLIVSIKSMTRASSAELLLGAGTMWFYAAPSYLGNSYILGDVRFYIEKRGSVVSWESWYYRAIGFGNRDAIARGMLT